MNSLCPITAIPPTPRNRAPHHAHATATLLSALILLLAGCSSGLTIAAFDSIETQSSTATGIHGRVIGGQSPISGATIQLYAAGATGNASAATPLIHTTVLTDDFGDFNITGDYSCAGDPMVYLVALGGNPGLGTSTNNTAIAQMVALGDCNTLQANAATTFITLNELTTTATVYALGGFITDYTNVGYAANNRAGFASAIATINSIVNVASGNAIASTPGSGITLPYSKLISLANSISACVNTTSPASTQCSILTTAATPSGGSQPADEVAVLANLAHHPTLNVTTIYNLATTTPPFSPGLTAAPSDWTLSLYYTGGGLALPNGIALDASGNAWIANEGSNAVTEISNSAFASGANGYTSTAIAGAQAIAIDASNNIWLANTEANNVLKLNPSGSVAATLTTGIDGPVALAPDLSGNLWVANLDGNSLTEFTSTGTPASGSPFTNAALVAPTGLAVDTSNNLWITSSQPGTIALFTNAGLFQNTFTDHFLVAPGALALDPATNHLWAAATGINGLTGLSINPAGLTASPLTSSPFVPSTLQQPLAVAVDSASTVWTLSNISSGSIAAFDTNGNPILSNVGALNQPVNLAIDSAGNLWVTSAGDSSVTQFLGLAAPTTTPIVTNLANAAANPSLTRSTTNRNR